MSGRRRIGEKMVNRLAEHFVAGTPARSSAKLCQVSRETASRWYNGFRKIIKKNLLKNKIIFDGEVKIDESYFEGQGKASEKEELEGRYNILDVSNFEYYRINHSRINHSKEFAKGQRTKDKGQRTKDKGNNHINE